MRYYLYTLGPSEYRITRARTLEFVDSARRANFRLVGTYSTQHDAEKALANLKPQTTTKESN